MSVGWNLNIVELECWTYSTILILFSEEYRVSALLYASPVCLSWHKNNHHIKELFVSLVLPLYIQEVYDSIVTKLPQV